MVDKRRHQHGRRGHLFWVGMAIVLISFFLQSTVEGVDRSKFKTCSGSGFCRRNRALADEIGRAGASLSPYQFSAFPQSASPTTRTTFSLKNQANGVDFVAEWTTFDNSIARFQLREQTPLHPRYAVRDVVIEKFLESHLGTHTVTAANVLAFGNGNEVRMTGSAFELAANGQVFIELNKRGFLSFEHSRAKSEEKGTLLASSDLDGDDDTQKDQDASAAVAASSEAEEKKDSSWVVINSEDGGWTESFGGHTDSKPRGPQSIGLDIRFTGSRHVFGIPEHASDFSLKDTKGKKSGDYSDPYRLYNLDVFEYEIDNPMALYGSVPIMLSHSKDRTVGVFWVNSAETWIDVEHTETGVDTHWMSETGNIDIFFFFGPTPADVLRQITEITGPTALPPLFALGYHQCKWNYKNQEDVASVDAGFDDNFIPYDVIWLDIEHTNGKRYFTWDEHHFPSPRSMQESIASKGRKMVTIVDPHIKRDNGYHVHKQASDRGYYVKNAQGQDYEGWCWPGSSSWVDYSMPSARFWWGELFSYDNYVGSTPHLFTWNDMNEPSVFNGPEVTMHKDALHHDSVEHRELHNLVGLEFHRATSMGLIKRNPGDNERSFVLSRAFFAGTQRWGAIWTGDNAASWSHLAISTPMLLSIGVTGIPFSGADVGGFFGNPEPTLLVRWYQTAAYQPFFRGHAHLDSNRREPWLFGEPYTTMIRDSIRARYALLPYWYTLFYLSGKTGAPPMRPMWFEFPSESSLFDREDQFMVGPALLVKPIVDADTTSTSVLLPGSEPWYDVESHQAVPSNGAAAVQTPLNKIPVFQRGGTIIPTWERARRSTTQMKADPFTLVIALNHSQAASGDFYYDDGHSFDYQKGAFIFKHFLFNKGVLTSSSIHTSDTFAAPNKIERIRILGLQKQPASVRLFSAASSETLEFSFSQNTLVIRNPNVLIAQDFKIEIK